MRCIRNIISLLLLTSFELAAQEPGTLDKSFGNNGIVQLQIAQNDRATGIALQPDGKIVLSCVANGTLAVARCTPNGSLDNSFGTNGMDTFQLSFLCRANAIAIQPDGKIVIGGESCPTGGCDFVAVRLNNDGSLDNSFNSNGIAVTDLNNGGNDYCNAIALQPDNRIVFAGRQGAGLALVRYKADGSLDSAFNGSGTLLHSYSPTASFTEANDVEIQADGKILVAGSADPIANTSYDFVVFRFNSDGKRDSSFGTNGASIFDFASDYDKCNEIELLPDGKMLLAGYTVSSSTGNDFAVVKYQNNGTLDSSFGSNGKLVKDLGGDDGVYAMTVQSDGRIVVAGASNFQFVVARFNSDGALDSSFGTNGIVMTAINGITDAVHDIALQTDGKIIAAGFAQYPPSPPNLVSRIAMARYHGNWGSEVKDAFKAHNVILYPNPANSVLNIQSNSGEPIHRIQLASVDGTIVKESRGERIETINLLDVPAGVYFVRLFSGDMQMVKPVRIIR